MADWVGTKIDLNTYMLRLAEVYLVYANAILGNSPSTSDPEALKYFNAVRARAGIAPKTSITYADIFQKRKLNLLLKEMNGMIGNNGIILTRLMHCNISVLRTGETITFLIIMEIHLLPFLGQIIRHRVQSLILLR